MPKQIEKVLWEIEKVRAFRSFCISPPLFPSLKDITRQSTSNFTKAEWENAVKINIWPQNNFFRKKKIIKASKKNTFFNWKKKSLCNSPKHIFFPDIPTEIKIKTPFWFWVGGHCVSSSTKKMILISRSGHCWLMWVTGFADCTSKSWSLRFARWGHWQQ